MESQSETTQTVSALKLPVLKTGEYDLWSMRMEQYLTFTDHALWEVIVNGDSVSPVASASAGAEAIPDEHLLKFHACKDAKSLWEAIKNRFGGNKESKKMQKTILKQNYENFAASSQEGLDKTYDRFQKLISQLEIHGEVISQEDANLKLLRSLPSAWNNIALIMRNKSDLDTLSMDDLYNNLKVYESEIKGKSSSSLNSQNVAFVSSDNSSSTNETVNTAHSVSAASSKDQASTASYADDVMFSFFTNQSNALQAPRNQGNRNRDAPRRNASVDTSTTNALVVQDEISGYQMGLESLEARIVVHEKNEAVYEEDIAFLKYDVQVKDISIKDLKNQLEEALKEKDDLKLKLENFDESSKNLTKLINSQISAKDKTGLDDSVYTTKVSETGTSISKTSKDIVEKPKTVRPNAPIIEDWDTDSDNDSVFRPKSDQTKPKFTKINFVKSGENVKSVNKENTHRQVEYPRKSQSPGDNRRNQNGMMTHKLGNGFKFIKKACFVCGSFNHLIKDCDFHDNKMVEKPVLNKRNFVPTAVVTKSGQVPVNIAKQSSLRVAASISTARPVNTAAPKPKV
ncbi:hypothetical protein Tco_1009468, partial [Tanacetum coccineum]